MDAVQPPAFADLLRRYRRAAGLTQEELAERARISVRSVSDLERGLSRRPRQETLQLLAAALCMSAQDRAAFVHAARVSVPPTLPTRDRPGRLPTALTSFIGRAPELAALRRLLTCEGVRLVTLVGAPGIGKTRLGVQLAAALQDQFADGIAFVPLAAIQEPTLVAAAIARGLGLPESAEQPTPERLGQSLRRKELLLVLDNCEQVLAAAPLLADLLQAAPDLKLLVTSRAVLHLSGEQEFPVPPLALPEMRMPLDALAENEAVRLFVARAQAVKPDFQLTAANGADVAAICWRLDGLPLAIELAARRSKLLTPEVLLGRLEHRLGVLTAGASDLPSRQQTLRATIDWSYQLLSAAEQRLFRWLAVFVGGWTLEAAETVCACPDDPRFDVLEGLQSLVDKSLVQPEIGVDGKLRFGMLETLREYAWEKLNRIGEAEALQQRHAAYFRTLAEQAEPVLRSLQIRVGPLQWPAGDGGATVEPACLALTTLQKMCAK
jgi:predicted ATPase/DNA-binding XRE family transcriptional regulator